MAEEANRGGRRDSGYNDESGSSENGYNGGSRSTETGEIIETKTPLLTFNSIEIINSKINRISSFKLAEDVSVSEYAGQKLDIDFGWPKFSVYKDKYIGSMSGEIACSTEGTQDKSTFKGYNDIGGILLRYTVTCGDIKTEHKVFVTSHIRNGSSNATDIKKVISGLFEQMFNEETFYNKFFRITDPSQPKQEDIEQYALIKSFVQQCLNSEDTSDNIINYSISGEDRIKDIYIYGQNDTLNKLTLNVPEGDSKLSITVDIFPISMYYVFPNYVGTNNIKLIKYDGTSIRERIDLTPNIIISETNVYSSDSQQSETPDEPVNPGEPVPAKEDTIYFTNTKNIGSIELKVANDVVSYGAEQNWLINNIKRIKYKDIDVSAYAGKKVAIKFSIPELKIYQDGRAEPFKSIYWSSSATPNTQNKLYKCSHVGGILCTYFIYDDKNGTTVKSVLFTSNSVARTEIDTDTKETLIEILNRLENNATYTIKSYINEAHPNKTNLLEDTYKEFEGINSIKSELNNLVSYNINYVPDKSDKTNVTFIPNTEVEEYIDFDINTDVKKLNVEVRLYPFSFHHYPGAQIGYKPTNNINNIILCETPVENRIGSTTVTNIAVKNITIGEFKSIKQGEPIEEPKDTITKQCKLEGFTVNNDNVCTIINRQGNSKEGTYIDVSNYNSIMVSLPCSVNFETVKTDEKFKSLSLTTLFDGIDNKKLIGGIVIRYSVINANINTEDNKIFTKSLFVTSENKYVSSNSIRNELLQICTEQKLTDISELLKNSTISENSLNYTYNKDIKRYLYSENNINIQLHQLGEKKIDVIRIDIDIVPIVFEKANDKYTKTILCSTYGDGEQNASIKTLYLNEFTIKLYNLRPTYSPDDPGSKTDPEKESFIDDENDIAFSVSSLRNELYLSEVNKKQAFHVTTLNVTDYTKVKLRIPQIPRFSIYSSTFAPSEGTIYATMLFNKYMSNPSNKFGYIGGFILEWIVTSNLSKDAPLVSKTIFVTTSYNKQFPNIKSSLVSILTDIEKEDPKFDKTIKQTLLSISEDKDKHEYIEAQMDITNASDIRKGSKIGIYGVNKTILQENYIEINNINDDTNELNIDVNITPVFFKWDGSKYINSLTTCLQTSIHPQSQSMAATLFELCLQPVKMMYEKKDPVPIDPTASPSPYTDTPSGGGASEKAAENAANAAEKAADAAANSSEASQKAAETGAIAAEAAQKAAETGSAACEAAAESAKATTQLAQSIAGIEIPVFDGKISNATNGDNPIPLITQEAEDSEKAFICKASLAMYQAINFDQNTSENHNAEIAVKRAIALYNELTRKNYLSKQ